MNKFKTLIEGIKIAAEFKIQELVETELTGKQKKKQLDEAVTKYVISFMDAIGFNPIAKFIINKYLLPLIPTITQAIYDLLADKISAVTKR